MAQPGAAGDAGQRPGGIAVAVGDGVRSIHAGDAVFGVQAPYRARGAAVACGVAGLVAFSATHALKLRAGLRVVIVGATGGIGGMAVQLAHPRRRHRD